MVKCWNSDSEGCDTTVLGDFQNRADEALRDLM